MKHRDAAYKLHENGDWKLRKYRLCPGVALHGSNMVEFWVSDFTISSEVVRGRCDSHKEITSANTRTNFDQISMYIVHYPYPSCSFMFCLSKHEKIQKNTISSTGKSPTTVLSGQEVHCWGAEEPVWYCRGRRVARCFTGPFLPFLFLPRFGFGSWIWSFCTEMARFEMVARVSHWEDGSYNKRY